jgi:hypothetical protein
MEGVLNGVAEPEAIRKSSEADMVVNIGTSSAGSGATIPRH